MQRVEEHGDNLTKTLQQVTVHQSQQDEQLLEVKNELKSLQSQLPQVILLLARDSFQSSVFILFSIILCLSLFSLTIYFYFH